MIDHRRDAPGIGPISLVGSYPPRQCGIATFTQDLYNALSGHVGSGSARVLAVDDVPEGYAYPEEVCFRIPEQQAEAYVVAGDLLNVEKNEAVFIQHEYGIFGGKDGSHVLDLMHRVRGAVVTTLHTVLTEPSPGQRAVMLDIVRHSDRVVVMSHLAEQILREVYQTPPRKIAYIPHGIHAMPFSEPALHKVRLGLAGKRVLLTFGLLSPGKGIETAIRSLPGIVERYPEVVYVVLGATHPHLYKREGHAYRQSLEELADNLGVSAHVRFENRFVSLDELGQFLQAADVYVMPYPNEAQITSGTLAYAVGAGKAVVSTPFWHAREMLAEGRGTLFPFHNAGMLTEAVNALLEDEAKRNVMRKRAYEHGQSMIWPEVAKRYLEVAAEAIAERENRPAVHESRPGRRNQERLSA